MQRIAIAALAVLACAVCNTQPGGLGLGRPNFTPPATPPVAAVRITQVYAPTSNPAGAFVQLENASGAAIDFNTTKLTLATMAGSMDVGSATVLGGDSNTQWGAGNRRAVGITKALQVHPSAGELAVFNGAAIQGYASWGFTEPVQFGSAAQYSGAPNNASQPGLPFPVPDTAAVNLDPNIPGPCVGPTPAGTPGGAQSCPQSASPVVLSRIAWPGIDPNGGYVEVFNTDTANPVDIYGLQICTGQRCSTVIYSSADPNTPAGVLAAGNASLAPGTHDPARAVIYTGHTASDMGGIVSTDVLPLSAQGEVFLLPPAIDANTSTPMSYVRYGDAAPTQQGNVLTAAINAGLWSSSPNAILPTRVSGENLARQNVGANPPAWVPSTTAPQTGSPQAGTWSSCAYPKTLPGNPAIVIQEIANTTPPRLRILNVSGQTVNISGFTLALGTPTLALNAAQNAAAPAVDVTQFANGAQLWVELSAGATCTTVNNLCWANAATFLGAQEAALLNSGNVVFYVQWGGPATRLWDSAAVSANLWPSTNCYAVNPNANLSLTLQAGQPGYGVADYTVGYPTFP